MSISASQLVAMVQVQGASQAVRDLVGVGAASDGAGDRLKSLAVGGALLAGGALVGLGVKSLKMAGDFQSSSETLVTGAGEMQSSLDMVRQGMLKTATDTGTSTDELVSGMFEIESAGQHGKKGLETLTDAAEGARVGAASLADVANGVTTEMTDYAASGLTAAQATNTLITAVSEGKTHMGDLATAMATILPTSAAVHVSLSDTAGAMATMTGEGTNAAAAATYLRQLLIALEAPASKGAGALKAIGLSAGEVSTEMKKSLPDALQTIMQHLAETYTVGSPKYVEALKNIAGGSRQMQGILELTGTHMQTFQDNVTGITDAVNKGGNSIIGWSKVQGEFNQEMDQAKEVVEVAGIKLGTILLPAVSDVLKVVTPLAAEFSGWLDTFSGFGADLQKATAPIKDIQTYLAPLPDAFERGSGAIHTITNAMTPLVDTFDHAKSVIGATTVVTKPLVDSFDRANGIIPKFTTFITKTKEATSPLVTLFLQWKPVLVETLTTVEKLAKDVEIFATGIAGAAEKSGVFQSALQFIHDILPDVDAFLVRAGAAIDSDLLPPLESLITNVGYVARDFTDWLDKSGTAKSAIADLGTAVTLTAQGLGVLVGWTADVIGWFEQGGPQTYILAGAVTALGLAFAGLKVANTVAGFQQMFSKLSEGDGIVTNLASKFKDKLSTAIDDAASKQFPNLKKAMDDNKKSAEDLAVSEEKVGTVAKEDMASGVQAGATESEASLASVETQANAASTAEERVATTAETTMSEGVATGSAESAAALDEIAASAEGATVAEETVGTTAETKMAGGVEAGATASKGAMSGLGGAIGGLAIGIALMGNQLAFAAVSGKDFVTQFNQGDWLGILEHFIALGVPGGQLASTIDVFTKIGQAMGLVKNDAQDMDKKTVAAMTDMEKQSIAQGAQLSTGLQNLFQTLQSNADGTFSQMDDDAYNYLKDVENYVSQAQAKALQKQIGKGGANIVNANAYASGTDYASGGPSLVGERGAELVLGPTFGNLPQGSRVIPHAQTEALLGGLGGGGGNQPIHVHVHIADHEFEYLTNAMMQKAMTMANLTHGRKTY